MVIKKKKNVALVFGITKDYVFALANVLVGLKKYNKQFWDDIIVYHDGISSFEQKSVNRITKVKFIDLSESKKFEEIANSHIKTMQKYSVATFYRYECLRLLDDYHKVIWNDVDIIIQGDISGLLGYADKTGVAFSMANSNFVVGSSLKHLIFKYEMFKPLWNVGIMVLSDKLDDYQKIYNWCMESTVLYDKDLVWPDLAVFNLMIQEFGIEPENINPDKYVCLPTSDLADKAMIIHAYGDKKFWNSLEYFKKYSEWIDNAIRWSKLAFEDEKNELPLVSCIMSCYERYDYLKESINSLLAQTYPNFEIIVVLEKSKNQSKIAEVLKEIGDSRIRIIKNKEKLGFAASLNVGIGAANGKYIARMDDDDLANPCRFAIQVKYLEEYKDVGIVGSDMLVFGRDSGVASSFEQDEFIKASTLFGTPFKHPTVMMRKSLLDKYNLRYDPDYFTEDYELWSRAVYLFKVANIPKPLVYYRSHANQATSSDTNNNELKIHNSHKRIMRNQLKKYLDLELSDNEIEMIQARKSYMFNVLDEAGLLELRKKTVAKVLRANDAKHFYDKVALEYTIGLGQPQGIENGVDIQITNNRMKKYLKPVLKPIIKPFAKPIYGRLADRLETIMANRDEMLRLDLQGQIDEIKKERKKNG